LSPDGGAVSVFAPAKINLYLHVLGRRPDGYHRLDSLVAFADIGDRVTARPAEALSLTVGGPEAGAVAGLGEDNLVVRAARLLMARAGIAAGAALHLEKHLPAAAGIGGGSSDAAAALRLIGRANDIALDDPRVAAAACATGADVPVCLAPHPRLVRGIGEILSDPLVLPKLFAVLANPTVALATRDVFGALAARAGSPGRNRAADRRPLDAAAIPSERAALVHLMRERRNDLEEVAMSLAPAIADVLAELRALPGCELARMSGSGATCFGIFPGARAALAAARHLRASHPGWWICATALG